MNGRRDFPSCHFFCILKPCIFLQSFVKNWDHSQKSVEDNQINDITYRVKVHSFTKSIVRILLSNFLIHFPSKKIDAQ